MIQTRRQILRTGAAGTAATLFMPSIVKAQSSITIAIGASHPVQNLWVYHMKNSFQPEVDKALEAAGGKFKINWKEAYGGTLYKFTDTMKAVRDNIVDIGFVGTLWEADSMPLQNVTYFTPFSTGDHKTLINIFDKLHDENAAMKDAWTKNNMAPLASFATETYHVWSNFPIKTMDDLKNRRINAPGTSANWLRGTGSVPVDGALTTYYTNIQTGVTEGALSFASGILPTRVFEVAKYVTEVDLGAMYVGGIGINKRTFDRLAPEVQKVFSDVGRMVSQRHAADITARNAAAVKEMTEKGAVVSKLADAEREKWIKGLPNIAKTWVDASGPAAKSVLDAYFKELRAAGSKPARDWDKEGAA
jgi:TRAP-type C4-dicarboxylate transport system substrate-binding protein